MVGRLVRARPWLAILALVAILLLLAVAFLVIALRHPPEFVASAGLS